MCFLCSVSGTMLNPFHTISCSIEFGAVAIALTV